MMMNTILNHLEKSRITNQSGNTNRILSIDALRGFDMFWIVGGEMIFKSLDTIFHNAATQFISNQLDHVEWLGFHFYDIIMPLFLFIVGVSIPFSYSKRLKQGHSKKEIWKHALKRIVILWILGMAVQGNLLTYSFNTFHFYCNTLQAIAAGYFIATLLVLHFKVITQIILTLVLLICFWIIMTLLPTPSGTGLYEPLNNAALFLDKLILGSHQDGTFYSWILSSLNFGATTMFGVFSGYILRTGLPGIKKVLVLLLYAASCFLIALFWDFVQPIIKHIWTGSFVFYAGSYSILLLAFFYLIIDVMNFKRWSMFFVIIGSNAIVAYVAWHLFDFKNLSDIFIVGLKQYTGTWYDLIRNTGGFATLFLLLWYMNKNRIFVKI
jgi:predicted acyltransferase